jgi:oligopeptide transport system substrate-binding protein
LKEWRPQEELLLIKNPLYWDLEKERPDRISLPLIADERTALQLFEQGELDLIGDPLSSLPVDAIPTLKKKWKISSRPMGATTVISFNVSKPPFHHPKIRKALTLAINRQALITHILQTDETPAQTLLQQGPPLFPDGDLITAQRLFDEGLSELGMTRETLPPLNYLYSTSDKNRQIAQAIQQQWREGLGITVHLENREHKILIDTLAKRDYTLAQHVWIAHYHDPMSILERFQSKENVKNTPGWESAAYTHTLEASSLATSEERIRLLKSAEALLIEEMPVCPLYHWEMHYIVRPGLQGAGELVMNTLN